MKTKDNEKRVRMNFPIRSAREMESIMDFEVERHGSDAADCPHTSVAPSPYPPANLLAILDALTCPLASTKAYNL